MLFERVKFSFEIEKKEKAKFIIEWCCAIKTWGKGKVYSSVVQLEAISKNTKKNIGKKRKKGKGQFPSCISGPIVRQETAS